MTMQSNFQVSIFSFFSFPVSPFPLFSVSLSRSRSTAYDLHRPPPFPSRGRRTICSTETLTFSPPLKEIDIAADGAAKLDLVAIHAAFELRHAVARFMNDQIA